MKHVIFLLPILLLVACSHAPAPVAQQPLTRQYEVDLDKVKTMADAKKILDGMKPLYLRIIVGDPEGLDRYAALKHLLKQPGQSGSPGPK